MHILIADDHAVVRRGLKEILADALPGAEFSEAGNGDEVLSRLGKTSAALLVLDINMPGRSGMDVLRDVKHSYPRLPVIILLIRHDMTATKRHISHPGEGSIVLLWQAVSEYCAVPWMQS